MEIVKLIGADVLPEDQKLTIETARVIRLGFLQQEVYNPTDTYVSLQKELKMMEAILHYHERLKTVISAGVSLSAAVNLGYSEKLIKMKYDVPNDDLSLIDKYIAGMDADTEALIKGQGAAR